MKKKLRRLSGKLSLKRPSPHINLYGKPHLFGAAFFSLRVVPMCTHFFCQTKGHLDSKYPCPVSLILSPLIVKTKLYMIPCVFAHVDNPGLKNQVLALDTGQAVGEFRNLIEIMAGNFFGNRFNRINQFLQDSIIHRITF